MNKYIIPPKIEKAIKTNRRLWRNGGKTLTVALAFLILGIIGKSCWDGYWRTYQWEWRTPVIFQTPLMIKKLKPQTQKVISPVADDKTQTGAKLEANKPVVVLTEQEIVMKQPHGSVLWNIYMLESTRGKADWCRLNGKGWGGFGVMNENHKVACYETFEKAVERAEHWLTKLNPDKNLASALCQYNLGTPNLVNCNYYQDYLSL